MPVWVIPSDSPHELDRMRRVNAPAYSRAAPEVSMKKLGAVLFVILLLVVALPTAQPSVGPDTRLVLLIAVDQFRYDYLTRFRPIHRRNQATAHGRRRLHERESRTLSNRDRYRSRDDAVRRHAFGQRNYRQRLVRSGNRCNRHERLGCDREAARIIERARCVASAAPGEHRWRRIEDGLSPAKGR